ncbi:MAG: hypothetical protein ACYDGR_13915, partial [Candidatus Dormibacteria bacterium]
PALAGLLLAAFKGDAAGALVGAEALTPACAIDALDDLLELARVTLLSAAGVRTPGTLGVDARTGEQIVWLGETVGARYLRGAVRTLAQACQAARAGAEPLVELELAVLTIAADHAHSPEPIVAVDEEAMRGGEWLPKTGERRRVERRMASTGSTPELPGLIAQLVVPPAPTHAPAVEVEVAPVQPPAQPDPLAVQAAAVWYELADALRAAKLRPNYAASLLSNVRSVWVNQDRLVMGVRSDEIGEKMAEVGAATVFAEHLGKLLGREVMVEIKNVREQVGPLVAVTTKVTRTRRPAASPK